MHTNPTLFTLWDIEKHGSFLFTHEVFSKFQEEVLAARNHCDVQSTTELEDRKIVTMTDNYRRVREVICFSTELTYKCSCMLFESTGIPCRHIIHMFRGARLNELPMHYVTKRWMKNCKRDNAYDSEGNLLVEKATGSMDASMRRKMSSAQNKFEDIFQVAKTSEGGIDMLIQHLESLSFLALKQGKRNKKISLVVVFQMTYRSIHLMTFAQRGNAREYWDMQTKIKRKTQVHADARYAKMLAMIDAIVQTKGVETQLKQNRRIIQRSQAHRFIQVGGLVGRRIIQVQGCGHEGSSASKSPRAELGGTAAASSRSGH
ncbi:hypothetical protein U9M48_005768 [Paspalum notatum var. saurae]|uniref:Protein FAR1-RELATED SEQUENCE n=1 Tax=Paspalum notatum var. saurae TaxID=547442 RepID=A0AAQ3PYD4_PASNO